RRQAATQPADDALLGDDAGGDSIAGRFVPPEPRDRASRAGVVGLGNRRAIRRFRRPKQQSRAIGPSVQPASDRSRDRLYSNQARRRPGGTAVSFGDQEDVANLRAIEKLIRRQIPVSESHPKYGSMSNSNERPEQPRR